MTKFNFEATSDPRKGVPYVARLKWADGKLVREFYDMNRTWGRKQVTVHGTFEASDGDVVEMRTGGSWRNDHRYWCIVRNGQLIKVAAIQDSAKKARVERYLRGEISAEEV